ncbi:hypothetical protein DPMN_146484 [Dreissena polymorpha]|uniref:Uncharacterized protein n=1 Tax=Dreissena polymorpha TaxID=45954 RepID=A0A9D4J2D9_DREPO|nr:hypothetical protein DPMN_146484 [Dreissena polymorpha]
MSQQQRTAALLRQAADLLNVNTRDSSKQYQHLHHAAKAFFAPDLKEGGIDMRIQELWQCVSRSLITTKDHLLKELDRPGRDTSTEVNQINWSYKQAAFGHKELLDCYIYWTEQE